MFRISLLSTLIVGVFSGLLGGALVTWSVLPQAKNAQSVPDVIIAKELRIVDDQGNVVGNLKGAELQLRTEGETYIKLTPSSIDFASKIPGVPKTSFKNGEVWLFRSSDGNSTRIIPGLVFLKGPSTGVRLADASDNVVWSAP